MAKKLPVLKAKGVVRALLKAGFYVHHQTGSRARLLHRTNPEAHVVVRPSAPAHGARQMIVPSFLESTSDAAEVVVFCPVAAVFSRLTPSWAVNPPGPPGLVPALQRTPAREYRKSH
jgi:predicted RNA binding protein YcfA (HicA-like mRNA interferase family)